MVNVQDSTEEWKTDGYGIFGRAHGGVITQKAKEVKYVGKGAIFSLSLSFVSVTST